MKKKILSVVMAMAMLLSILPMGALAAGDDDIVAIYKGGTEIETFNNVEDFISWNNQAIMDFTKSDHPEDSRELTIKILKDITVPIAINEKNPALAYGIGVFCDFDLNGHAITFVGEVNGSDLFYIAPVFAQILGSIPGEITIGNGKIVCDYTCADVTVTRCCGVAVLGYGIHFEDLEVASGNNQELSAGIFILNYSNLETFIADRCVVDVKGPAFNKIYEGTTDCGVIKSGSYKNLNGSYKIETNSYEISVNEVDNDTEIIGSLATTAIIVDDGNAYLYDTLQEAVNAVEPDGTIQLLRQPGDQSVTVPTNAYFRIVSFDGASADVGAITFATGEGYQVIVDKDGWVYVEEADIPVTDISLNRTWLTLTKGETAGLTATVSPSNATDKDVTWISSDTAIATVADGTVTAVAPGTATITATAGGKSATCTVTVTAAQQPSTPSTSDRDDDDDGYSISVPASSSIRGGSITVSPRRADRDDTVTITVTPDDGYVLDELSVTTRGGDAVSLRQRNDSQYTFEMPAGSVVIHVSFMEQSSTPAEEMSFSDVPSDFWAYNEIQWAFENGYMNGTTSTTFVPGGAVTRQQVWMILARMAGSNPVDMAAARAWAVNNGISDGTDPGAAVTRQQLVALLHRFAAQNGYDTTARADLSGYPDVASVASYAADAMAWSVAEGIVGGTTQGTLNPAGTANRAQFAVILWRFYQTSAN